MTGARLPLKTLSEIKEKDLELRLAALFHDIAKPNCYSVDEKGVGHFYEHPEKSAEMTEMIMKDLKYSNEEISNVVTLIKNHDNQLSSTKKCLRKILNKGNTKITEILSILKGLNLVLDIQIGKHHYYKANLDELDVLV